MDVDYGLVQLFERIANPYLVSLFLRTTVVSANQPGHVTINAGFKALATDGPPARFRDGGLPGAIYSFFGDEFGMVSIPPATNRPAVGDTADLITSHCDPTVNMHDVYHVIEDNTLVDIWPVDARGACKQAGPKCTASSLLSPCASLRLTGHGRRRNIA